MTLDLNTIKDIDIPEARIIYKSDGIVRVHFKKDVTIDMDMQLSLLALYRSFLDKPAPFLFISDEGVTSTKEVRELSGDLKVGSPIKASAVIVTNVAHALIASSYQNFNQPKHPYKVFSKKEDGVAWLKQFVNN
jgi:hypothetical protein